MPLAVASTVPLFVVGSFTRALMPIFGLVAPPVITGPVPPITTIIGQALTIPIAFTIPVSLPVMVRAAVPVPFPVPIAVKIAIMPPWAVAPALVVVPVAFIDDVFAISIRADLPHFAPSKVPGKVVVTDDLPGAVVPRSDVPDIGLEEVVSPVDDAQVIGNPDSYLETEGGWSQEKGRFGYNDGSSNRGADVDVDAEIDVARQGRQSGEHPT
jgi:hypothetical protein